MVVENNIKNKEEALAKDAKELGIDLILLFGSRADNTNHKDSDFDVAYRSKTPLESDLAPFNALMGYLGSDNLHILNLRSVKPLTLYEIVRNCKVLYAENMMDFYNLRAYAFRRYEDEVKPLYKILFNKLKANYLS